MKMEANYLSTMLILFLTMLLTASFVNLINNSVVNIMNSIDKTSSGVEECVYTVHYSSVKIVLINKSCIGEVLNIVISSGETYTSNEYILVKTSSRQLVKIVTREEIIVV